VLLVENRFVCIWFNSCAAVAAGRRTDAEHVSFIMSLCVLQEEMEDRPRISTLINSLANYSNTIPAATDPDAKPQPSARMGTLIGVYLPCIQNIFGVIFFIRLTWVVGTAGALLGFLIVLTCCCVVST
jgi:potassium/chloride transporter 4/5/6